jgi:hypothetical protein
MLCKDIITIRTKHDDIRVNQLRDDIKRERKKEKERGKKMLWYKGAIASSSLTVC